MKDKLIDGAMRLVESMPRCFFPAWGRVCAGLLYPYAEKTVGRDIRSKLVSLRQEAARPFARRRREARERLADMLEFAGRTVPYYRDLFRATAFDPARVRSDERFLADLPFLTKDILREQGRRLVSEEYADKVEREQKTGSSTGLAATVFYDAVSLDWTAAQNVLMLEWGGKRRFDREAHLSTRFADTRRPRYPEMEAKKCFVLNRYNIYTEGFDDRSQERLLRGLRSARARVVQGHPSSLFALSRYLHRQGRTAHGLFEIFVSTGEMMTGVQRERIEEVLGVRVSNRYGACEFGVMAQELADGPRGGMLVSDSMVWPESVPLNGELGGAGELVFTGLRNKCMPLVRYRIGDAGVLCERGDGWWIVDIVGRTHDTVEISGTSYPTHYVQDALDRCGAVADFQILERAGKAVELRIVADEQAWPDIAGRVAARFPGIPVRRIEVEELVFVGVRGKFSYVLREAADDTR